MSSVCRAHALSAVKARSVKWLLTFVERRANCRERRLQMATKNHDLSQPATL